MKQTKGAIYLGETPLAQAEHTVKGETVDLLGDVFYRIDNFDAMEPFFISLVSSSDHWLFISSTGGLSAGRVSAEQALFPYYTEDKLAENSDNTGNKAILLVTREGRTSLWEPFSIRQQGVYSLERNLYKNIAGTAVVFEEINRSLGLSYRYAWRTGDAFGFVKTTWLANLGADCQVEFLDGLQNLLPASVSSTTQNIFSVLLDAYKRAEVDPESGLAILALNSTLTDLAEPSESLLATTVFQTGLEGADYLLSSLQLDRFRGGMGVEMEKEVRGRRGAYFAHASLQLEAKQEKCWHIAAEVSQDSAAIVRLAKKLRVGAAALGRAIEADIEQNRASLVSIVANADGVQLSNNPLHTAHHFANTMFNLMRGGVFADQYRLKKDDFVDFIRARNRDVLGKNAGFFEELPAEFSLSWLLDRAESTGSADLLRLAYAYLPLSFSRRHGDPSRPWNRFAINIKKPDGSRRLDYEGNWRDIFQNWEALAYSYPEFTESMISTFLNATTLDGYNPYRITRQGIDWEVPEPNNPWANIGYWSDHQIIYLQKLMEISDRVHPGKLESFLSRPLFSSANVPYQIKPYAELLKDPYNTIEFDWERERAIEKHVKQIGSDAKLVLDGAGEVLRSTLAEKLLILLLAKLVNFVPEGGIWMNTQRPEWNDANNALVGKGLSVVTVCYLRRFVVFYRQLLEKSQADAVQVSQEVGELFTRIAQVMARFEKTCQAGAFDDEARRAMMDALGQAGSDTRWQVYRNGVSGQVRQLPAAELRAFLKLAQDYIEQTLRANRRPDHLYHAYNILKLGEGRAGVGHLYEMLEGQVAILSSGMLSGEEALALLESMRRSRLYRADQHSYILYPDRELPGFLAKNCVTPTQVKGLALVAELVKAGDTSLMIRDEDGNYHFNGLIRNLKDVNRRLEALKGQPRFRELVEDESGKIAELFEEIFHHDEFTGRSGTFFAYEGLGSIYWHMVSKLLLAVQETAFQAKAGPAAGELLERYADIRKGQSFNKDPESYGAFPTDPYSHTPKGRGARQPGMTGMVKEEILARMAELGLSVENGCLVFDFLLLNPKEFLEAPSSYAYARVDGKPDQIELPAGALAYSFCQVPVVLRKSTAAFIEVHFSGDRKSRLEGLTLDEETSRRIFERDGTVHHLVVGVIK